MRRPMVLLPEPIYPTRNTLFFIVLRRGLFIQLLGYLAQGYAELVGARGGFVATAYALNSGDDVAHLLSLNKATYALKIAVASAQHLCADNGAVVVHRNVHEFAADTLRCVLECFLRHLSLNNDWDKFSTSGRKTVVFYNCYALGGVGNEPIVSRVCYFCVKIEKQMETRPYTILFVCLGNICRSPAAHAVMEALVAQRGLNVSIDSAGIGAWHIGQLPDSRMRRIGRNHGYDVSHIARQVSVADFSSFDAIVGMDSANISALEDLCPQEELKSKIWLMADFLTHHPKFKSRSIPDPYYGDDEDFELAIELIEDAATEMCERIENQGELYL